MKVTICDYDELPAWVVREGLSNNGVGREYATYLLIEDGDYRACYSDAMEPEDAQFTRDLRWVAVELRRAAQAVEGGGSHRNRFMDEDR